MMWKMLTPVLSFFKPVKKLCIYIFKNVNGKHTFGEGITEK
jgi:hypothetical protein